MLTHHPLSLDPCWHRLRPKSGPCQDGLLELQSVVVSTHHLFPADPCWRRLQRESGRCQDGLLELQSAVVSTHHPFSADPCWPRLQSESGQCRGVHHALQSGEVLTHHPLSLDPCWPRLRPKSKQCQDVLLELPDGVVWIRCLQADFGWPQLQPESGQSPNDPLQPHKTMVTFRFSCLLHFCLHQPPVRGASVPHAPPMQHGVGQISQHFHLVIFPWSFGLQGPKLGQNWWNKKKTYGSVDNFGSV